MCRFYSREKFNFDIKLIEIRKLQSTLLVKNVHQVNSRQIFKTLEIFKLNKFLISITRSASKHLKPLLNNFSMEHLEQSSTTQQKNNNNTHSCYQ